MNNQDSAFSSEINSEEPEIWDKFKWVEFMRESNLKTEIPIIEDDTEPIKCWTQFVR